MGKQGLVETTGLMVVLKAHWQPEESGSSLYQTFHWKTLIKLKYVLFFAFLFCLLAPLLTFLTDASIS